ncbi:MAG: hypothetical protein WAQ53_06550 [Thiofilum sp.]|uniref:hypothetical protein n=1 Tax=Thiofilum sp. TaxID=2212733 RepID=UPI0025DE6C44|nr:hypothetical protein [Thiofilum sp.]MBK8454995.1 hypothetical protein [Thiofilum sp.]
MMKVWMLVGCAVLLVHSAQAATPSSAYTSLNTPTCKTLESDEEGSGWYKGQCKGIAGYSLQVTEGDLRQSINVVTPQGKVHELDLISKVSSGFSALGEKAEWRMLKQGSSTQPIALIVRYNASEDPEDSSKITSYLVVSKVTKQSICVTDIVKPQAKANEKARQLADKASTRPCK